MPSRLQSHVPCSCIGPFSLDPEFFLLFHVLRPVTKEVQPKQPCRPCRRCDSATLHFPSSLFLTPLLLLLPFSGAQGTCSLGLCLPVPSPQAPLKSIRPLPTGPQSKSIRPPGYLICTCNLPPQNKRSASPRAGKKRQMSGPYRQMCYSQLTQLFMNTLHTVTPNPHTHSKKEKGGAEGGREGKRDRTTIPNGHSCWPYHPPILSLPS
jgi:hypothetical protein